MARLTAVEICKPHVFAFDGVRFSYNQKGYKIKGFARSKLSDEHVASAVDSHAHGHIQSDLRVGNRRIVEF
jgi:hypothetical protein